MAVDYSKGLKVNTPIIFLAGLVFIVGSLLTFFLIIKHVFGNYKLEEILPTKENLTMVSSKLDKKAAILYSKYTENMLPEGNTWVADNIDTWESFMKKVKMGYDIITDLDLELGDLKKYGLIILPGAKSVSDRQLIQIKHFLENGGSVFATSGTASFSDEGKWRGWEFFSEVFGLKFTKELEPDEYYSKIHTLRGNLPITAQIPTGYTLNIATWDRPIYAEILDPRTIQVSYWFDFKSELGLVNEQINKSAGIAFGSYGKGRFVWFGFELNSVIGREDALSDENYWTYFDRLFENCINWLNYMPTAFVRDWPEAYDAAAVLIVDANNNPSNLNNFNAILKNNQKKATFIVNEETAKKHASLINNLKSYGEISSYIDIGFMSSMNDTLNQLHSKKLQNYNINKTKKFFKKNYNYDLKSFLPAYGFFNNYTKQGSVKNNIDCIITDSLTDRTVPRLEIWDEKPLITISKTARDDNHIINKYGLVEPEYQRYTYIEDIDRILFGGGLYVCKLHSDIQLKPEYVSVVNDIINYAREKNMWLTSVEEIKKWWMSRGDLEFRYDIRSKRRLALEIFNPTNNPRNNFVVQIHINKQINQIQISSDIINTKIPKYSYNRDNQILYLYIDGLKAGETRNLLIDYENVSLF